MKAAILSSPRPVSERPLQIGETADPRVRSGHVLLRVKACGVCRTDLHIVEGELPPKQLRIIPGHQIVGEVVDGATAEIAMGTRVGVSWLGGTDGTCRYCESGLENLCDAPTFTGYTVAGGYAEYAFARADFVYPLPDALDDLHAAPLLCAGIIGFRSLRVAGVEPGERVGLVWLRRVGASRDRSVEGVELRGLCFHPWKVSSRTRGIPGSDMGGQRERQATR